MLCREIPAQPISGAGPSSMPAASPEDNLPFLLDEDPSRGSSKHGSQAGSSVHGAPAVPLLQEQQPAQQLRQEQHNLQQPRRAWSVDPQPGLQVWGSDMSMAFMSPKGAACFSNHTQGAEPAARNLPGAMHVGLLPTLLKLQAQLPYGLSPAQGQAGRVPLVSQRLQSMGTQHAPKQPASNPFLISSGECLPRPAHSCCLGCRSLGQPVWELYMIDTQGGREKGQISLRICLCCSVRLPAFSSQADQQATLHTAVHTDIGLVACIVPSIAESRQPKCMH